MSLQVRSSWNSVAFGAHFRRINSRLPRLDLWLFRLGRCCGFDPEFLQQDDYHFQFHCWSPKSHWWHQLNGQSCWDLLWWLPSWRSCCCSRPWLLVLLNWSKLRGLVLVSLRQVLRCWSDTRRRLEHLLWKFNHKGWLRCLLIWLLHLAMARLPAIPVKLVPFIIAKSGYSPIPLLFASWRWVAHPPAWKWI